MRSGPYISPFGDVMSSALSAESPEDSTFRLFKNLNIVIGQVVAIYTVDDKEHPHNNADNDTVATYTLYDVMVFTDTGATDIVRGCRVSQPAFGGGINNFFEVVQTEPKFHELNDKKGEVSEMQGHFVLVGFVNGTMNDGIILGSVPHPNSSALKYRPTKEMGVHTEGEIQGLNFKVDKDGAFTLTFQGPKEEASEKKGKHKRKEFKGEGSEQKSSLKDKSKQTPFPSNDAPTVLNIDKNGNVTITNNAKQRIKVDREARSIRIDNDQTYINMEQGKDGHAKVAIVANNIELGHVDSDTSSPYTKTGEKAEKALQPIVMGDDLKNFMEQLIDEICAIVHPTGTGPSGTPVNKQKFQELKSRLPELLSKKHRVEK